MRRGEASRRGPRAPKSRQSFVLIPGLLDGKPVVTLVFGRFGQYHLDGDDVERLKNELDSHLRAAQRMGQT